MAARAVLSADAGLLVQMVAQKLGDMGSYHFWSDWESLLIQLLYSDSVRNVVGSLISLFKYNKVTAKYKGDNALKIGQRLVKLYVNVYSQCRSARHGSKLVVSQSMQRNWPARTRLAPVYDVSNDCQRWQWWRWLPWQRDWRGEHVECCEPAWRRRMTTITGFTHHRCTVHAAISTSLGDVIIPHHPLQ